MINKKKKDTRRWENRATQTNNWIRRKFLDIKRSPIYTDHRNTGIRKRHGELVGAAPSSYSISLFIPSSHRSSSLSLSLIHENFSLHSLLASCGSFFALAIFEGGSGGSENPCRLAPVDPIRVFSDAYMHKHLCIIASWPHDSKWIVLRDGRPREFYSTFELSTPTGNRYLPDRSRRDRQLCRAGNRAVGPVLGYVR